MDFFSSLLTCRRPTSTNSGATLTLRLLLGDARHRWGAVSRTWDPAGLRRIRIVIPAEGTEHFDGIHQAPVSPRRPGVNSDGTRFCSEIQLQNSAPPPTALFVSELGAHMAFCLLSYPDITASVQTNDETYADGVRFYCTPVRDISVLSTAPWLCISGRWSDSRCYSLRCKTTSILLVETLRQHSRSQISMASFILGTMSGSLLQHNVALGDEVRVQIPISPTSHHCSVSLDESPSSVPHFAC